jgi:hypothetical protein
MREIYYSVFETNADLLELMLVHKGRSLDVAETLMVKRFVDGGYSTDYIITSHDGQELVSQLFTDKTLSARGECQG